MAKQNIIWPPPVAEMHLTNGPMVRASIGLTPGRQVDWPRLWRRASWLAFGRDIDKLRLEYNGRHYSPGEQPDFAKPKTNRQAAIDNIRTRRENGEPCGQLLDDLLAIVG